MSSAICSDSDFAIIHLIEVQDLSSQSVLIQVSHSEPGLRSTPRSYCKIGCMKQCRLSKTTCELIYDT